MNRGEDHRMNSASGMKNLLKQVRGGDVDSLRPNECGASFGGLECRFVENVIGGRWFAQGRRRLGRER